LKDFGETVNWFYALGQAGELFPPSVASCQMTPIADEDEFEQVQAAYSEYYSIGRPKLNTWVGVVADVKSIIDNGPDIAFTDDWMNIDGTDLYDDAWGPRPQPNNNVAEGGPPTVAYISTWTIDTDFLDDVSPYRDNLVSAGLYKCCFSECPF
jgi:hypothetical protein